MFCLISFFHIVLYICVGLEISFRLFNANVKVLCESFPIVVCPVVRQAASNLSGGIGEICGRGGGVAHRPLH